jgi:hypothetical protein
MTLRNLMTAAVVATTATMLAAGCSTAPEDELGSGSAAQTPSEATDAIGLGDTCARLFKRHESVRAIDMQQGVIRWGCGDVPGVTDPDLGQEYCEYNAVQNGKIVKKASDLTTGPVTCVFTSVFTGAGQAQALRPAMADPANLGTAAQADAIVQMQHGFNNRGAAITLISDCSDRNSDLTSRLRKSACYQAYAAGGPNQAQLKNLCNNVSSDDSAWSQAQQLGARVLNPGDDGYEAQRDIAGCMAVRGAGVSWRNSDPMICSRVSRSAGECSCSFNSIPSSLMGLPFTGWVDDQIPSSCRLAKVNGAAYPDLALCTLSDQEVSDLPLNPQYSRSIANFCHDRFGVDLVMKLPLRSLQESGTCNGSSAFCSEYMAASHAPDQGGTQPTQPSDLPPTPVTREAGSRRAAH